MASRTQSLIRIGLGILVVVSLILPRLRAATRLDVENDEVYHHLKSWHHRYGTNDIYPEFLSRVEAPNNRIPPRIREFAKRLYNAGPLFQRAIIILIDPQPPLFPVAAELVEKLSDSSLIALRLISVVSGVAFIALLFQLGRTLADARLGLILAATGGAGAASILYAGIGRPYAFAQAAVVAAFLAYTFFANGRWSLNRFLLVALLAQCSQWMAWSMIGPLVFAAVARELLSGTRPTRLLRSSLWYICASVILIFYMCVQLKNPTISDQAGAPGLTKMLGDFALTSFIPFVNFLTGKAVIVAAVLFIGLGIAGVATAGRFGSWITLPLVGSMLSALAANLLLGAHPRFEMTYTLPTAILGGMFVYTCVRKEIAVVAVALLLVLSFTETAYCWSRSEVYYWIDPPFTPMARAVHDRLRAGENWTAYPTFFANCLYGQAALPDPLDASMINQLPRRLLETHQASALVVACDPNFEAFQGPRYVTRLDTFGAGFALYRVTAATPASLAIGQ